MGLAEMQQEVPIQLFTHLFVRVCPQRLNLHPFSEEVNRSNKLSASLISKF